MNENQTPENKKKMSKMGMLSLAWELGYVIALPLVLFGYIGKLVDTKLSTKPWFALLGIVVAIFSTTIWLTRKIKDYLKN
jgi:F0F1-type ATP synthase assembly protein I